MSESINDKVQTGETICAVLKRDGETIQVVEGKTPEQKQQDAIDAAKAAAALLPDRYQISLVIHDKLTGETRKYEVNQ